MAGFDSVGRTSPHSLTLGWGADQSTAATVAVLHTPLVHTHEGTNPSDYTT